MKPVRISKRSSYVKFTDAMEQAMSSQRHLDLLRAPIIVTYGTHETPEFQRQNQDFAAAVKAAGKSVVLHRNSANAIQSGTSDRGAGDLRHYGPVLSLSLNFETPLIRPRSPTERSDWWLAGDGLVGAAVAVIAFLAIEAFLFRVTAQQSVHIRQPGRVLCRRRCVASPARAFTLIIQTRAVGAAAIHPTQPVGGLPTKGWVRPRPCENAFSVLLWGGGRTCHYSQRLHR
jgi:hypothetical protein